MKKKFFSLICTLLAAIMCFAVVGCTGGGNNDDGDKDNGGGDRDLSTKITFNYESGTPGSRTTAYKSLADYWNNNVYGTTYNGTKINFKVNATGVSSDTQISKLQASKGVPDLIELKEDGSQGVLALNLLQEITTSTDGISEALQAAYRMEYKTQNGTTYRDITSANAKLYGLPSGTSPSVLFYNTTLLSSYGIEIISVAEEDLAAYNVANGTNYLPHGYYTYEKNPNPANTGARSTTYTEVNMLGGSAEKTGYRVFNDRISMNWDELYAISTIFTPGYNTQTKGTLVKGFATEYWFWMGWSIGGDCLAYDSNVGKLQFTLGETNKNYMVTATNGLTINGVKFEQGDLLDYSAREYLTKVDAGTATDATLKAALNNEDQLYRIPSMRDTITYFCAGSSTRGNAVGHSDILDKDIVGYGVTEAPTTVGTNSSYERYFTEGKVAFIYHQFETASKFGQMKDWNIAPAPQYKEFNADGSIKTVNGVEIKGYKAAHGNTTAFAIPTNAKNKTEAEIFMKWLASEEIQKKFLEYGSEPYYVSNRVTTNMSADYLAAFARKWNSVSNFNVEVLAEACQYVTPGDWAYVENKSEWIAGWADYLHKQVETGNQGVASLFDTPLESNNNLTYTQSTNNIVAKYPYLSIVSHKTIK